MRQPDFRQSIVGRLCGLLRPRHILLAGGRDPSLADILAQAASVAGTNLHVATRQPAEWLRAARREAGDRMVLHVAAPEDAIGLLPVPDLCWVDADPNWFAVGAILRALAAQASRLGKPFPVTIVENAGWPYARRDSYDDPASIPDAMRHPHEKAGLLPGRSAPAGGAGLHGDRYNAVGENEPGNGVLTAIEDFMLDRTRELRLVQVPGFGGLAALCPRTGAGAEAFAAAALAEDALAIAGALEAVRLDQAVALQDLRGAVARAESLNRTLRAAAPAPPPDPPPPPRYGIVPRPVRAALRPAVHIAGRVLRRGAAAGDGAASAEAADLARLRASRAFDAVWYLESYGDVAAAGHDPAEHYLRDGARELRDPGPFFSTDFYVTAYPDVAEAGINPLLHYLASGAAEGRDPGPHFRTSAYVEEHPELDVGAHNPLEHFLSQRGSGQ